MNSFKEEEKKKQNNSETFLERQSVKERKVALEFTNSHLIIRIPVSNQIR